MTYCYTNPKTNETVERNYPIGENPKRIRVGGRVFYLDVAAAQPSAQANCWPKKSISMAVARHQIPAYEKHCRRMGVQTRYDNTGKPILTSSKHEADHARAVGMFIQDSFAHSPRNL